MRDNSIACAEHYVLGLRSPHTAHMSGPCLAALLSIAALIPMVTQHYASNDHIATITIYDWSWYCTVDSENHVKEKSPLQKPSRQHSLMQYFICAVQRQGTSPYLVSSASASSSSPSSAASPAPASAALCMCHGKPDLLAGVDHVGCTCVTVISLDAYCASSQSHLPRDEQV